MSIKDSIHNATNAGKEFHDYFQSKVDSHKVELVSNSMQVTSALLRLFLIGTLLLIVVLFLSVAGAIAIGQSLDSMAIGFLIVAGSFSVLVVVASLFARKWTDTLVFKQFSGLPKAITGGSDAPISSIQDLEKRKKILELQAEIHKESALANIEEAKDNISILSTIGSISTSLAQSVIARFIARKVAR
jgi:hypothetical protein